MGVSVFDQQPNQPNNTHNKMVFFKVLAASGLIAAAAAAPAAPAPYHAPAPAPYHEPVAAPVYEFTYGVADDYSGANFGHSENRNNYDTKGEYRVNLPDGRVQIVTYSAGPDGYVADVKYEGEAHYDEYKPAPYKPAPKPVYHKPAPKPVYHKPAPVYHAKPVVHHAPVYHAAPVHHAPVYHAAPAYHKPAPAPAKRTYSFVPVTEAPAAEVEAKAAPAEEPVVEEAAVEAAPAEVRQARMTSQNQRVT